MIKKLSLAALTLCMTLGLTACDERTVAAGAAAVGGAIVAGALYDNSYDRTYWDTRGYYDDRYYWDRYDGRWYRGHDGIWIRGSYNNDWNAGGYYGWGIYSEDFSAMSASGKAGVALANKYKISQQAAGRVLATFNHVRQTGKLAYFRNLGMSAPDIQRLSQGHAPTAQTANEVAHALGTSAKGMQALLQDATDEFRLQKQHDWNVR